MAKKKAAAKAAKAGTSVAVRVVKPPVAAPAMTAGSQAFRGSVSPPKDPRIIFVQTSGRGSSGTRIYGGYFSEEYLTNELHGTAAADQYDKMRRSDAKVKMCLNAVKTPIIAATWEVEPATTEDPNHVEQSELINHVLFNDMDKPLSKSELLSIADFGHSVFEITHKLVRGHKKFGDYIGIKSLGWRSPRSILYWRLNPEDGSIDHIHQLATGDLERYVDIPGEFLIVNSLEKEGDLYEGVSLLRACYGAWKRKNLLLKLMAIGSERHALPPPTAEVPSGQENTQQYLNLIAALENLTSNENNYLTYPAGWKIDFLKSTFDPDKLKTVVDFENTEIVSGFMANFLLLGSTQSGSRAVSMDQSEFFLGGIQYIADEAISDINHKLIPQLIKMKYGPQEAYPKLKISGISDKAGKELADALKALCESQVVRPDDLLEGNVRKRFGLPKKSDKGVRIVQAPRAMQQGDNVITTDHPEKLEQKERNVEGSERGPGKKKALRLTDQSEDQDDEESSQKLRFIESGNNTCEECHSYHDQIFYEDDPDLPELPLHPNCECELVEYYGKREPEE
jgi:hypothetical protein